MAQGQRDYFKSFLEYRVSRYHVYGVPSVKVNQGGSHLPIIWTANLNDQQVEAGTDSASVITSIGDFANLPGARTHDPARPFSRTIVPKSIMPALTDVNGTVSAAAAFTKPQWRQTYVGNQISTDQWGNIALGAFYPGSNVVDYSVTFTFTTTIQMRKRKFNTSSTATTVAGQHHSGGTFLDTEHPNVVDEDLYS